MDIFVLHAVTGTVLCRDLQAEQSANENTPHGVGSIRYLAASF